jgi:hypothetical protein
MVYKNVLTNMKKFLQGKSWCGNIVLRQQSLFSNDHGEDSPDGKYWWGAVYLNNDGGNTDWHKKNDKELAVTLFHELSHHWGTEDKDANNVLNNAHNIERILFSNNDLVDHTTFKFLFPAGYDYLNK